VEAIDDAAPECSVARGDIRIDADLAEEDGERAPAPLHLLGTLRPRALEQGVAYGVPFGGALVQPAQARTLGELREDH
jgi:hypothetical protein